MAAVATAIAPVGHSVAVGSEEGKVYLYDVDEATGSLKDKGTLDDNKAPLTALAYSPDGSLLAVADAQRKILVYDIASGQVSDQFKTVIRTRSLEGDRWIGQNQPMGIPLCEGQLDIVESGRFSVSEWISWIQTL